MTAFVNVRGSFKERKSPLANNLIAFRSCESILVKKFLVGIKSLTAKLGENAMSGRKRKY